MQNNTFYKYKPINDFTLDSLKNKYFYYSRQEQLDDPFDMYTPVDTLKTNEEIKELFRHDSETEGRVALQCQYNQRMMLLYKHN